MRPRADGHGDAKRPEEQGDRGRLGDDRGPYARKRCSNAETAAPDVEVGLVDRAVAVTVGRQVRTGLAERLAPEHVVSLIDDTVFVVVAGVVEKRQTINFAEDVVNRIAIRTY